MDKDLEKKIFAYYLHYYQDVCCIKNPAKRAAFRLNEEATESKRLKLLLSKIGLTSLAGQTHCLIGAGTGGLAITLKKEYQVHPFGIEPDPNALAITKDKCRLYDIPPENFKAEMCENISFPDNQFDFVHCYTVLEHVQNISRSLDEMIRITKPGGHIYINTPNYSFPYEGHYKIPFPTFLPKIFGSLYLRLLGKSPAFLKTINFITAKKLDSLLQQKSGISWTRITSPPGVSGGRLGWLLNYLKFKHGLNPNQEIFITKTVPKLSILIVNYNSSAFIAHSLNCLEKLTRFPYQVFILDNGSRQKDWRRLKKIATNQPNVSVERKKTEATGSLAHGSGLNYLASKINTPYFAILDADAVWLKKDWDQILINQINDQIKVIGAQADGPTKPQDFPLIYAALFETESFKKLNIDFRPKNLNQHEDTGHELREKYLAANLKGKVLIMKNTRQFKSGPFYSLIGVGEYYLPELPHLPFASHFGRGSSLGKAKYQKTRSRIFYRLPLIGSWLIKIKGIRERNRWFKICRQVINNQ